MANARRDEFVKRLAESRSEEYLSPPVEIAKSQTHVELASASIDGVNDEINTTTNNNNNNNNYNSLEVQVPPFSSSQIQSSGKDDSARREQLRSLLKQAYHSFLSAILDPIAYLREKHNFELKVLTKIVKCDGCHGVLWGIHRQGLQCTKCFLSIHEKCRELVHENCTSSSDRKTRRSLKLDDSMLQLELVNRYQDLKSTYPTYLNRVREVFACVMSEDFRADIKQTQQSFLQKSVKQIRTRLKIHVISASELLAKDSCGTSDPYVTIQCGFSRLKRTKTRKKNLNPVWNEIIEFEFVNTADGIVSDSGNCGTKMIVRVWDEDQGLKAQLDKMLTNEQDDFLGQVVLDLNDLNVGVEETYRLQPRHDGSHVSGYLVMKIEQKVVETLSNYRSNEVGSEKSLKLLESAQSASYLEEYRCLHRHLFAYLLETSETNRNDVFSNLIDTTWLLQCFPKNCVEKSYKVNYFKDTEFNLMLKHFANKYAINEKQKQMIHLECFYTFFIDSVYYYNLANLGSTRRLYSINCQLLDYMTQLISSLNPNSLSLETSETNVDSTTTTTTNNSSGTNENSSSSSPTKKTQNHIIGSFIKKTLALPLKIILVLNNFRLNFTVRYRMRRGGRIEMIGGEENEITLSETAIDELRELVNLFRAVCGLMQSVALKNTASLNRLQQLESKTLKKFSIHKPHFGYDLKDQYYLIKQAIEHSMISSFYNYLKLAAGEDQSQIFESSLLSNNAMHKLKSEERRCSSRSTDSSLINFKSHNESESIDNQSMSLHFVSNRIEILINLISKKLPIEIELNEQLYFSAFYSFNDQFNHDFDGGFRQFCSRVFFEQFMLELLETVKSDLAPRMQLDLIKQHLNLHLLLKRFLIENGLNLVSDFSYTISSLSELFQPFLLEYIRLQEDQFIKYAHKIYDVTRINSLAEEIANMIEHNRVVLLSMSSIDAASGGGGGHVTSGSSGSAGSGGSIGGGAGRDSMSGASLTRIGSSTISHELIDKYSIDLKSTKAIYDLENYYSASVTDFFTIMHELLQTLLSFDSSDPQANLPHQMGFVNLIKSKLLAYSAHVKKEFQKIYTEARNERRIKSRLVNLDDADNADKIYPSNQLTITSCILMNNFQKTIDFLNEIEPKLTNKSKLNRTVVDQLESIRLILREDLHNMICEYALEYEQPLLNACKYFQLKMYVDKTIGETKNGAHHIIQMKNLIDQSLFNIFNDRFMICKIILFDLIFKQLLEQIFKLTVKCIEGSIILNRDAQQLDSKVDSEFDSSSSSSSSNDQTSSFSATGFGLLNKLGTFFQRTTTMTGEKSDYQYARDKSLLNDFQYTTIQHYLKHIVEFFSGDEEFLKKDYLINTNEYQSALRTLDLYLNSSNQLISSFVRTQNIQQNNIDFRQCFGKVRIQVEMKQNPKLKNEINFSVCILEARFVTWSNPSQLASFGTNNSLNNGYTQVPPSSSTTVSTYVELYAFGPFQNCGKNWPMKIVPATYVDGLKKIIYFGAVDDGNSNGMGNVPPPSAFEFKVVLSSSEAKKLSDTSEIINNSDRSNMNENRKILEGYEIQMVMREIISSNGQTNVIGVAVFNLGESVQSAHVWKKLIREEQMKVDNTGGHENNQKIKSIDLNSMSLYGNMDLWLPLRPRLKINDYGYKVLKVLGRHTGERRALEFVKLKALSRNTSS